MMSKSKWIGIGSIIIFVIISTVLAYQHIFNQKRPHVTVTISDGMTLDTKMDDDTTEKRLDEKGISLQGNEKEIAIDRTAFLHLINDLRKTESNWLGKHEWISLDNYSIDKEWFTLDETYPMKTSQIGSEQSLKSTSSSYHYYVFAWTRNAPSFQERTVTEMNIARLQLSNTAEQKGELYFGIDEAITMEYDPKTNHVRLMEPDKGLRFSNIETTVEIDENEIFYGETFTARARDARGMKPQQVSLKNKYVGNIEMQMMKYSSTEKALEEIYKSRGPFQDYAIVKSDDYVLHEVHTYPETDRATIEVKFAIE